jgi:hypothetical protein
MHNLLDITEAQLRGGGDLIAGLTVKTTEELHDIINRLSKGNMSDWVRSALIEKVLAEQAIAREYVKAFGITTTTVDTV